MIFRLTLNVGRSLRNQISFKNVIGKQRKLQHGFAGCSVAFVSIKLLQKNNAECEAHAASKRLQIASEKSLHEPEFSWRKLFDYLYPYLLKLSAAVASALVVAFLNIEIPRLLGNVVDVISQFSFGRHDGNDVAVDVTSYFEALRRPAAKLCLFYLAQSLFTFSYITCLSQVGERMAAKLRNDLFSSIVKQDIAFFDDHRTGELLNRITADVQEFKSSFKICVSQGLRSVTQAVGCLVSLYLISPTMTGYMVVVVPSVIAIGSGIGSFLRHLSRKAQAQVGRATGVAEEALGNIRTVRAFAMEGSECKLYEEEVEKARVLNERLGYGIGIFQAGTNLFLNAVVLGTVYIGGQLMSASSLTPGDLMAFLVATQTLQRSLAQMSLIFGNYVRFISSGARVFEYLDLRPSIRLTGGARIPFHSLFGEINFDNVSFSYPTRKDHLVLDNFNLTIPAGKVVALVGSSGGGKSTVAALLERFYDVDDGCIVIDGQMIESLDPSWLRRKAIGFINQEPVLFATSILENIRYGRPEATDQEVIEAAKLANAHNFIGEFPSGYETVVGERGVAVSGGQKQRIAIARALLKNPAILILDEATSALDSESERLVQEALDVAVKGRTVLVIAHRLSTIRNADLIAVVSEGSVAEVGSHEELMKKKGLYYRLVSEQHNGGRSHG